MITKRSELSANSEICYNTSMADKEPKLPRISKNPELDNSTQWGLLLTAQERRKGVPSDFQVVGDNYKPKPIYDEYDYNLGNSIAKWVWNAEFKKFKNLQAFKEDLITSCVANLWKKRQKYSEMHNATYRTFAYMICRQTVWKTIGNKQGQYENNIFDNGIAELDKIIGESENGDETALIDIIADEKTENTQEKFIDTFDANNAHYEAMHKIKNQKQRQIITYYAQGYKTAEIAEMLECNRSYVGKVKAKYKKEIETATKVITNN